MKKRLRSFYCDDEVWVRLVEFVDSRGESLDEFIERSIVSGVSGTVFAAKSRLKPASAERETSAFRQDDVTKHQKEDEERQRIGRAEEFSSVDSAPIAGGVTDRVRREDRNEAVQRVDSETRAQLKERLAEERPRLKMTISGRTVAIDKERFVIGRASRGNDFVIRDENVSRQHCAILFHAGSYYIQDLQSTNGVEFGGKKVELRKIDHGDLYEICGYEVSFELKH